MRTNVVLDDVLVAEAMRLSGATTKKEVIHLALKKLVESGGGKRSGHHEFLAKYTCQPDIVDGFVPLSREEANER